MKISKIKLNKNGKYEVTIDNTKYILYQDVIIKYLLFSKKEIDNNMLNDIIKDNIYYEAYDKIIKFINIKLRTKNEIRNKLNLLNVSTEDQDKIINVLENQGYLNDEVYIKAFINDKINLSLEGPNKIKNELLKNNFSEEKILNYLDNYNDLWEKRIEKIINKRVKINKNYSKKMLIKKINNELINLGYSKEMFSNSLNNIIIDDSLIYEKEYQKLYNKLIKKYDEDKAKILAKQKLYIKGFNENK
ncbi:MAG: RecX family transcriptional regulator [bacterium]|nr:RecX family transcriptional regulator [bacterium]